MTHIGYVFAGWGIALGVLAIYAWRTLRRGRVLAALVPADQRRWSNPSSPTSEAHD